MRARITARLVSLAALLPLLAFAVSGVGYDRFRCAFTGEVSEAECCPAEDAPATPIVRGAPCCDRETAVVTHPPVEPTASHVELALAAAPRFTSLPVAPVAASLPAADALRPLAPPRPLRVLKQSFLI